jgi:hypothetical protein
MTEAQTSHPTSVDSAPPARGSWWFPALPRNRVAVLRVVAYLFIPLDVFWLSAWGAIHGKLDGALYQPLLLGRLVPFPTPDQAVVAVTRWGLLVAIACALWGRFPRTTGFVIALLYLEWSLIGMSYGKVDHDRLGFIVLLFALPTVGRIRVRDDTPDPAAGWIIRMAQFASVATYFLAAVAKLRFGGWGWVNSATMLRAVLRRGTDFGDWFGRHPETLHVLQWMMLIGELASPLLLIDGRWRRFGIYIAYLFHIGTYAALTIAFFPHLVTLLSFLQLERLVTLFDRRHARARPPPRPAPAGT